jgi:hypothetical protein
LAERRRPELSGGGVLGTGPAHKSVRGHNVKSIALAIAAVLINPDDGAVEPRHATVALEEEPNPPAGGENESPPEKSEPGSESPDDSEEDEDESALAFAV